MKVEIPKLKIYISPELLKRSGFYAVQLIRERTAESKDAKGSDFPAYSRKPFAMPYGFLKKQKKRVDQLIKDDEIEVFVRDGKTTWVLIKKGYSFYKENFSRNWEGGKVNLKLSGNMMKAITVTDSDKNSVSIGWVRPELAERAYYVENKGREFMGLSDSDMEKLYDYIKDEIQFQT